MNCKIFPVVGAMLILTNYSSVTQAQQTLPPEQPQHHTRSDAEATTPKVGPHDGTLRTVAGLQTESVVSPGGLKVYLYSMNGQLVAAKHGRGVASLSVQGNPKRYRYDLFPAEDGSLSAEIDLSKIAGRQISVDYQLVGITSRPVNFRDVTVVPADESQQEAVAVARQKVCPVSGKPLGSMGKPIAVDVQGQRIFVCCVGCVDAVEANPAKYVSARPEVQLAVLTKEDATLVAMQAKCPVMDEPLGSMGQPIKLLVGGKPLFLCCKGCIKKVEAEPEKYLAMVHNEAATVSRDHEQVRRGVFKITAADKPFIAAQKNCPVMDEPLDAMGGPYMVNANGRAIYICCPGCAKKIAAEPQKYLDLLTQQGVQPPVLKSQENLAVVPIGDEQVRPGVYKVTEADALFVKAQQRCPVMDEPLDAMGGPYKVNADGKAIYICCPGCAKKIAAEPQKYLATLRSQGVTPPATK